MPSTVPEARWRRLSLSRGAPILPSENPRGGAGQGLGALSAWRVLKSKRARPRSATCFLPRRSGLGRPGRQCEVTRGDRCNVVSVTPESIYQRRRNPGIASHEFGVVQVTSFPGRRGEQTKLSGHPTGNPSPGTAPSHRSSSHGPGLVPSAETETSGLPVRGASLPQR